MKNTNPLKDLASAGLDFKHVKVKLLGEDGNVFSIMGRVTKALRRAGANNDATEAFIRQVTSSSCYDEALAVVCDWVTVT